MLALVTLSVWALPCSSAAVDPAFRRRQHPAAVHRRSAPAPSRRTSPRPTHAEIVAAVRSLDSFGDVTDDDIARLGDLLS
jgi:CBS domain-containing membrane protein